MCMGPNNKRTSYFFSSKTLEILTNFFFNIFHKNFKILLSKNGKKICEIESVLNSRVFFNSNSKS